jgi:hypothetical protein
VHRDHAEHPGARGAGRGDRGLHVEEDLGIVLEAAPARRLQDAEEARLLEVADGGVGEPAQLVGLGQPRGEHRLQRDGARLQLGGRRNVRGHGGPPYDWLGVYFTGIVL